MNQRMLIGSPLLFTSLAAVSLAGCMMDDDAKSNPPAATGGSGAEPSLGGEGGSEDDTGAGGDPGENDCTGGSGGTGTNDGGAGSGGAVEPTGLHVSTDDGPAPADLSCLGVHTAPSGMEHRPVTLDARAFGIVDEIGNPVVVPGLEVQIFEDNQIPASTECGTGCTVATDNGDGSYDFEAPEDGWIAYRALARPAGTAEPATLRTMETNFIATPEEGLNTIFQAVLDGLHAGVSIPRDETAALLAGRFLDCQGRFVEGARVSLRDANGDVIPVNAETRPIYIGAIGPEPSRDRTTASGQWSFINTPTDQDTVVVEIRSENDVLVGCEVAPATPNSMSVVRVFPLRRDAPATCQE